MPTGTLYVQITGWLCVALMLLLLFRAVAGGTLKIYPIFYGYVAHVLVTTAVGLSVKWSRMANYRLYYWVIESISTLLGVGVTWEIHRRILAHYPGVRRLAGMLLSIIFTFLLLLSVGRGEGFRTLVAAERDLRTAQAIVLLTLFALIGFYSVPLGRNVRGIAIGYVFGIATAVLNLSLRDHFGRAFAPVWTFARPIEYLAGLAIWCTALWSLQPDPEPPNQELESDYEWASAQAAQAIVRLRTHLTNPDGS